MTEDDLRAKCLALAAAGDAMAAAVLRLLAELDDLRDRQALHEERESHHNRLIGELAERVLLQSELLGRSAERRTA